MPKQHFERTCPELSHEKQSSCPLLFQCSPLLSPRLSGPRSMLEGRPAKASSAGGEAARQGSRAPSSATQRPSCYSWSSRWSSPLVSDSFRTEVRASLSLCPQHWSGDLTQCGLNKRMWGNSLVMPFTVGKLLFSLYKTVAAPRNGSSRRTSLGRRWVLRWQVETSGSLYLCLATHCLDFLLEKKKKPL